jgi:plastocyanin
MRRIHRSVSRTTRLVLAVAISGVAFFGPVPEAEAQQRVLIKEGDPNNSATWVFEPAEITVPAGTTVTWEWQADDKHSATADDGSFDSGIIQQRGATWQHKFGGPGEFPYSCTPHPYMIGKVTVT